MNDNRSSVNRSTINEVSDFQRLHRWFISSDYVIMYLALTLFLLKPLSFLPTSASLHYDSLSFSFSRSLFPSLPAVLAGRLCTPPATASSLCSHLIFMPTSLSLLWLQKSDRYKVSILRTNYGASPMLQRRIPSFASFLHHFIIFFILFHPSHSLHLSSLFLSISIYESITLHHICFRQVGPRKVVSAKTCTFKHHQANNCEEVVIYS